MLAVLFLGFWVFFLNYKNLVTMSLCVCALQNFLSLKDFLLLQISAFEMTSSVITHCPLIFYIGYED